MRLILTTIILTMLAQPVWAMTVEGLYKHCKPYTEKGFSADGTPGRLSALACTSYIASSIENARSVCSEANQLHKLYLEGSIELTEELLAGYLSAAKIYGASANISDMNSVIQAFINYAETNPKNWQKNPVSSDWLSITFPCKV